MWYGYLGHPWSVLVALPIAIKQIACERLFHFHPIKTIARELGISTGAVRDWRIFINKGDFEWITDQYVTSRTPRIREATQDWMTHYPIGYSDVARWHGVRPSDVYRNIQSYLKKSPRDDPSPASRALRYESNERAENRIWANRPAAFFHYGASTSNGLGATGGPFCITSRARRFCTSRWALCGAASWRRRTSLYC